MIASDSKIQELLFRDKPDTANEVYLGPTAIHPFATNNSGSRLVMGLQHVAQQVVLNNGEEKIIQSGLDHQFAESTFSVKIEEDCVVLGIAVRYKNIVSEDTGNEVCILVKNLYSENYDVYIIPNHHLLHQTFGFTYKVDPDELNRITVGRVLKKGTILADSPAVKENGGYGFGVINRIALLSLCEVAEDGIIISESAAKKLVHEYFETKTIKFGSDAFLLNTYGDDEVYKGFPDIGEYINNDSILCALRYHDKNRIPALTSKNDLKQIDTNLDRLFYVKGPGGEVDIGGNTYKTGVVVDIKAYHNAKAKAPNDVYPKTLDGVNKYVNAMKDYYKDIFTIYRSKIVEAKENRDKPIHLSPRLQNLIQDALVLGNVENRKIPLSHKGVPLDVYTMEFVVKYTLEAKLGTKLSDLSGGKGVVVSIRPDHLMPMDAEGEPVDVVMDPTSIVSRMNIGRLYEIYITAASRRVRKIVREEMKESKEKAWNTVLEFLTIMGTEQKDYYANATEAEREEILKEIMEKEFYLFYRISSPKPVILIVKEIEASRFKPLKEKLWIDNNGVKTLTEQPVLVGCIYTILLSKTTDEALSVTSSPHVNHFGLPTSPPPNQKDADPNKNSPIRFMSETEFRLFLAYGGAVLLAELKDRANNPETYKAIYKNILLADNPGFCDSIVSRDEVKLGMDVALSLYKTILNVGGIGIEYRRDPESEFDETCDPRIGLKK